MSDATREAGLGDAVREASRRPPALFTRIMPNHDHEIFVEDIQHLARRLKRNDVDDVNQAHST